MSTKVDNTEFAFEASLLELCHDIVKLDEKWNITLSGLALDSRKVVPGNLFLACVGHQVDGRDYINEALSRGAIAVLCEAGPGIPAIADATTPDGSVIPIIAVNELHQKVGIIAHRFYQQPSQQMNVVAVTGTNGKTSCCHFIANVLQQAGNSCAVIGTIGSGFPPNLHSSLFTTPDSIALHRCLAHLHHQGAETIAMETSSHGLEQGRVNGVEIDIGVFTNLTREHLDYHGSMEKYGAAKRRLFYSPGLKYGVINADDGFGRTLINQLNTELPIYGYSCKKTDDIPSIPMTYARDMVLSSTGMRAYIISPWGKGLLTSPLLGEFNLSNLLAVITCLGILGLPFEQILSYCAQLKEIPGRMEAFGGGQQPLVIVDFAHTPDALENALTALKAHCEGRLICVFGCGGGRDKGKRPDMGQIAQKFSDFIVVTSDNPRNEEPANITADIIQGLNGANYCLELDRKNAIACAIKEAKVGDIVIVAGKGHEDYQQIGDVRLPFSDQKIVREILEINNG